jgi:N-acetylglucosaminyldiphosphoundecaprenol N-acetyl-beta-D-mannosaminyltransferase
MLDQTLEASPSAMPAHDRLDLGPVRISPDTQADALARLDRAVTGRGRVYFCFCEANLLSHAARDARLREVLDAAAAVYADGVALMWLARIHGVELPERVPGPTFILEACEYGLSRGWRHFFYGAASGVADQLASKLTSRFPGLQVAGTYSPPFRVLTDLEELEVRQRIESSRTDILWVGLGGPKQEFWVADHVGRIDVPVMLPVGAAFDFHAGTRPWAPAWVRSLGLEWIQRTLTGGRQTFFRNVRCVSAVLWLLVKEKRKRESGKRKAES